MAGVFFRRTAPVTSTVRSNIGPPGVTRHRPVLVTLIPAGPLIQLDGPVGSPSTSEAVTLKLSGTP